MFHNPRECDSPRCDYGDLSVKDDKFILVKELIDIALKMLTIVCYQIEFERADLDKNTCYGLSQLAKTLVPSYYCLYSLFNKIRDKGKIVSAG
jgi:hypothetical protein